MPKDEKSQIEKKRTQLTDVTGALSNVNPVQLCTNSRLGHYKFDSHENTFACAAILAKSIQSMDSSSLPLAVIEELMPVLQKFQAAVTRISAFNPAQSNNPKVDHDAILKEIVTDGDVRKLANQIAIALAYERATFDVGQERERKLDVLIGKAESQLKHINERVEAYEKKLQTQLEEIRNSGAANIEAFKKELQQNVGEMKESVDSAVADLQTRLGVPDEMKSALRQFRSESVEALALAKRASDETATYSQKALKIVGEIEKVAGEGGVFAHAGFFEGARKSYDDARGKWLLATFGLMIATGAGSYYLLFKADLPVISEDSSIVRLIATSVGRLILLSIGYFAIVWASRNYRLNKELAVANEHRRNALSTFRVFVESTHDERIKDTVLLSATRSIFAPSQFAPETDEQFPLQQLIKLLKDSKDLEPIPKPDIC